MRQPAGEDAAGRRRGGHDHRLPAAVAGRLAAGPALHVRAYDRDLRGRRRAHHRGRVRPRPAEAAPARAARARRAARASSTACPQVVHIEEPRQGIQFGVTPGPAGPAGAKSAKVHLRGTATATRSCRRTTSPTQLRARPLPAGRTRRARHPRAPQADLRPRHRPEIGDVDSNEFALEMLQFPFRQVFGDPDDKDHLKFYDLDAFTLTTTTRRPGRPSWRGCDRPAALRPRPGRRGRPLQAVPRPGPRVDGPRRDRHLGPVPPARAAPARPGRRAGALRPRRSRRADGAAADDAHRATRSASTTPMPDALRPGRPRASRACTCTGRCPTRCCAGRSPTARPAPTNRLGLPALPDRWVVLRVVRPERRDPPGGHRLGARGRPRGGGRRCRTGREGSAAATAGGVEVAGDQPHRDVGGSPHWSATYDAVGNRFAFHDRLEDLDTVAPDGADGDMATYVVAGWWKDPASDPLDARAAATASASCSSGSSGGR